MTLDLVPERVAGLPIEAPATGLGIQAQATGPVIFARYALGPNRLGLCGPDDWRALLGLGADGGDDRGLRELARGFDGAYPYLQLLAGEAGILDPLDRRVVEAYWLGTALPGRRAPAGDGAAFGRSLAERFRPRLSDAEWRWLAAMPAQGAAPVHSFHVLAVFPRLGLLRGEQVADPLAVMDACRIRWGRVIQPTSDGALVSSPGLELVEGQLRIGAPRLQQVRSALAGTGFVSDLRSGEVVAIHWDWICDRLDERQLTALITSTERQLAVASWAI